MAVDAAIRAEAQRLTLDPRLIDRPLNVDLSGGEKKKNETLQLGVLRPSIAVLDELDSGLDIDALRACARRVEAATHEIRTRRARHHALQPPPTRAESRPGARPGRGPDRPLGWPELSEELEGRGYRGCWVPSWRARTTRGPSRSARRSTIAGVGRSGGPGGDDPFADPLA